MSVTGQIVDGRFELIAEAGSGGMGTVYRARDLGSGATVAVKILTGRERGRENEEEEAEGAAHRLCAGRGRERPGARCRWSAEL